MSALWHLLYLLRNILKLSLTRLLAFNAALSIFGGLLIPLDDNNQKSGKFERLDRGRCFLEKAVTGLGHLGPGNPVLDRSVSYLKQLHGLVEEWGRFVEFHITR